MAFVLREIPKSEAHLYSGRHFWNSKGKVELWRWTAEDQDRHMYLVCTGGGGGPDNLPHSYIFYMHGLYIKFQGGYCHYNTPEIKAKLFTLKDVMIPMNLEDKTEDIIQLIFEAFRVYSGDPFEGKNYKGQIVVENIAYSTPTWIIDEGKGIFLMTGGPPLGPYNYTDQKMFEQRRKVLFEFSRSHRTPEQLYGFRLLIGDAHIDFLARYHLEDNDQKLIWQVGEAGVPADFQDQKENLISWIPKAVMDYTIQDNHIPVQEVDLSGLTVGESQGQVHLFYGPRFYPFFK